MNIPENLVDRERFYQDLIQKCTASQDDRRVDYGLMRHFYLFGRSPDEAETPYNKIFPHIDMLTAFLFASETTRFSTHFGPHVSEHEYERIIPINRAINDQWLISNADQTFGQGLTWSLVYNTMIFKIIVRANDKGLKSIDPFIIDPGSFGVLREDIPYLDRQEAMVHTFYTTKSQLEIDLENHPQKASILARLDAFPRTDKEAMPSGVDRIILSASTPTMQGNAQVPLNGNMDYAPKVSEDLVEMQELWLWDTKVDDYRVVTRASNDITIYDRPNFFIKGEIPFVQICPNPMYSYFWGMSEVNGLIGLQKWRNERTLQVKNLLDKQVDPPTSLTGWMGLIDEKNFALNMPGGVLSTDSMQAKVDRHKPDIPNDIFAVIHEIDSMFSERSGLQNIMMGKGESGVRSGRQTSELARLASARIKKRALVVEDALEKVATLYLKVMRKHDTNDMKDSEGRPFIPAQFADDFVVKVDSHSNSPLFVEDHKQLALELLQAHAIDRNSFIDMLDPPMKDLLLRKLKVIEKKEAEAKQQEMAMQAKKEGADLQSEKK
jgi:hypothetical protein